jgi:hypothetical protein
VVFQIARAGGAVPRILRRFLADDRVAFAAYYVKSDCWKLRAHHGLKVASTELCGAAGTDSRADMADRLLRSAEEKTSTSPATSTSAEYEYEAVEGPRE